MSHPVLPHSQVVSAITPNKPTISMPLVILILSFVDISARKDGSCKTLNTLVSIDLATQILAVCRVAKA
jgi:hypothetical protein